MNEVGRNLPRLDAAEKISGRATYIADIYRPGMLHGAIVKSPMRTPGSFHTTSPLHLRLPGVACVLTGDDMSQTGSSDPSSRTNACSPRARCVSLAKPCVLWRLKMKRRRGAPRSLLMSTYEELPAVLSPEEAMAPGAPLVHEDNTENFRIFETKCGGNLAWECGFSEGDVDAAWAKCDVIVEDEFETQAQAHVAIEPCGALAEIDAAGRVTIWSANQSVFRVQANVCDALGLPMSKVRCVTPRVGGGFGNKMEMHVQGMAAALALATGRPVKMVLSREEDFELVRLRQPYHIRAKTGALRDGTLIAREVEALIDCGAYGDDSPGVMGFSLWMARGPYRIANFRSFGTALLHQQASLWRFPRLRQSASDIRDRNTARRDRAGAWTSTRSTCARMNAVRAGDQWVGGGADPFRWFRQMPA